LSNSEYNLKEDYEIWTNNLTKVYEKGSRKTIAVDHIKLAIEPGIHGFLGPNGAGKTTTINMLMGAISITEGEAFIKGEKAGSKKARKMVGFLPQDPVFYGNMTAQQYLKYTANLLGIKGRIVEKKIDELLEYFELTNEREKQISKYSGGMKQKVGLASALIHDPNILILDEPTTNLDPLGRKSIVENVKKLAKEMSIFISSHILSEIEQMCEKVTIIDKGKLLLTDTISSLKGHHSTSQNIFILDTSANQLALNQLKILDNNINAWIEGEDNKIHIIQEDKKKLQEIISKLFTKNELLINSFHQLDTTLQDVFINLTKKEEG
jgi:ABC-2 type transport system ATP-binding protein